MCCEFLPVVFKFNDDYYNPAFHEQNDYHPQYAQDLLSPLEAHQVDLDKAKHFLNRRFDDSLRELFPNIGELDV